MLCARYGSSGWSLLKEQSLEKKKTGPLTFDPQDAALGRTLDCVPSACPAPAQVQQLWSLVITAASLASSREGGGVSCGD